MNSMYYLSISHRYADGHTSMDTIYINGADNAAAWVAWTAADCLSAYGLAYPVRIGQGSTKPTKGGRRSGRPHHKKERKYKNV